MKNFKSYPAKQSNGFFLLEALIAVLIFSLGLLGLVAMAGAAISAQSDAQYRAEAAKFTNEIISQMWVNVDRSAPNGSTVATSLAAFSHNPTTSADCSFSGTASSHALVGVWSARVLATGKDGGLPGASASRQQILVDTTSAGRNKVTVTLCWQTPQDSAPRKHVAISYIN